MEQRLSLAGLAVVGLSSIWSAEAFASTGVTFAALAAFRAYLHPAGGRLRWLARQAVLAGVACLSAHVLFAAATLAGTGELPDWGQYLAYLDAFLFGRLGDVTYDFTSWSPGLAVGAGYLISAMALLLLVRSRPDFARREKVTLLAITGANAYGAVIFGYLVDRSMDHVVPYVSLPALLIGTLWLSLLLRTPHGLPRSGRTGVLALALSVGVLLVAVAWSSIGPRLEQSALAHVVPGGASTRAALDRLWQFPPFKPTAPAGERLLERYMPGERESLVLAQPDLATEILVRSGRSNRLPIAYPWGDSFVAQERLPGLRDAVAGLRARASGCYSTGPRWLPSPESGQTRPSTRLRGWGRTPSSRRRRRLPCRTTRSRGSMSASACGRCTATAMDSPWSSSRLEARPPAGRTRPGTPTRRRTSSRPRSGASALQDPSPSRAGTGRRRAGRRRARRSDG